MKPGSDIFVCITTDHVEADLFWEEEQYRNAGVDYRHYQLRFAEEGDLIRAVRNAHVLLVDQAKITPTVIAGLPECRLIIRHGDGYDNMNLDAATEAGIVCINEPGFWSREVALQAFTLGLSLMLKIPVQQSVAAAFVAGSGIGWNLAAAMPAYNPGTLTAGIIGFGKIGSAAASLFKTVMKRVLVCDPLVDPARISASGAVPASLDEILAESDLVSLHVPATPDTIGLINQERIRSMKKGALLVNTSRGVVVDTEALTRALATGQLAGAALDSTVPEPLPGSHPLFSMPNVIITPHMGWYSEDALRALRQQMVNDVLGAREGRIPKTVVNPAVLRSSNLRLK